MKNRELIKDLLELRDELLKRDYIKQAKSTEDAAFLLEEMEIEVMKLKRQENTVSKFRSYRKKQLAEMRPYILGEDMTRINVSVADIEAGSPKEGDMIAHDPTNHDDQWLVSKKFFDDNYVPVV